MIDVLDRETHRLLARVSGLNWTQLGTLIGWGEVAVRGTWRQLTSVLGQDERDWPRVACVIIVHAGGPGHEVL